ncbi:MAG: hypothetical protein LBO69_06430 [Ignavibacteria bacterium]|jgi:DNA gyrase inhibitor GyrI|nr:hypothetical protein [Ignavibacteria bacterium]
MKILKIILIIVAVIIAVCIGITAYYGGFHTVEFATSEQGGEILVYEDFTGDYSRTGEVTGRVYNKLKNDFGIETTKGFGYYFDNPDLVEASKCRAQIGCILNPSDSGRIEELSKAFKIRIFPKGQYTFTDFPYKGMASIFVGMMKVYPEYTKLADTSKADLKGPLMEIYDVANETITYRICPCAMLEVE